MVRTEIDTAVVEEPLGQAVRAGGGSIKLGLSVSTARRWYGSHMSM